MSLEVANNSGGTIWWFTALMSGTGPIQYNNPAGIADGETVHLSGRWPQFAADHPVESMTFVWYNQENASLSTQQGNTK